MGNSNPGRYRKEGREAALNKLELSHNPYIDSYQFDSWNDGWSEGHNMLIMKEKEEFERQNVFNLFSSNCPWYNDNSCEATSGCCLEETCAIWYLRCFTK